MNKSVCVLTIIWLLAAPLCTNAEQVDVGSAPVVEVRAGGRASNPHILPKGAAVLRYLASLSEGGNHGIVSGQWFNGPGAWPNAHELFVEDLYKTTGKEPALLGSDYFVASNGDAELNRRLDEILIDQWKAGGLVTLTWSAKNPWYQPHDDGGGFCSNVPGPCVPGQLADLVRPETPVGANFKSEMDALAEHLQTLQSAGVVVLFRPFHEMNGNWFWWGVQTAAFPSQTEFVDLWRYTYRYMTEEKKLNNLLWVFSPQNAQTHLAVFPKWKGVEQSPTYYYPGADYVDVTGIDIYVDRLTPPDGLPDAASHSIPGYSAMVALGKPFGLAEFGPLAAEARAFDFDAALHEVVKDYPRAVYFMAWSDNPAGHKYHAIVSNPAPEKLMNDPLIITRDKVHY